METFRLDGFDCTCGFYLSNRIICQHAWLRMFQHELPFLRRCVKKRWYRDANAVDGEPYYFLCSGCGGIPRLPYEIGTVKGQSAHAPIGWNSHP